MGYSDYRGVVARKILSPQVVPSALESQASGRSVGRISIWPAGSLEPSVARSLILGSGMDVVVVRCAAEDTELVVGLQCDELVLLQADTLLYFEASTAQIVAPSSGSLETLSTADAQVVDELVGAVFAGYRNHWSADPVFGAIDVTRSYRDWAQRCLDGRSHVALLCFITQTGQPAGFCMVDEQDPNVSDVLLAGVVPTQRRQGAYQQMMLAVIDRARSQGRATVAISTQAANVGVMRAWCRVGMLPTIALNTLHAVRREHFPFVA